MNKRQIRTLERKVSGVLNYVKSIEPGKRCPRKRKRAASLAEIARRNRYADKNPDPPSDEDVRADDGPRDAMGVPIKKRDRFGPYFVGDHVDYYVVQFLTGKRSYQTGTIIGGFAVLGDVRLTIRRTNGLVDSEVALKQIKRKVAAK